MTNQDRLREILPSEVYEAMQRFDTLFYESLDENIPTISKTIEQMKKSEGKRIRPILLLLVGGSFAPISDELINGSIFIEMFHLATLIHDDVVDESDMRRGQPSMNAVFGNQKAVLIGDYILAEAIHSALETKNKEVITVLSQLGKQLSEGELLQIDAAELGHYSEEQYYKIIERKTASLIRASMSVGYALSGEDNDDVREKIRKAGTLLGRAFQIRDDIFDYIPTKNLGKPTGHDILENKITLPLIYALNTKNSEAKKVEKLLRHRTINNQQLNYIIDFTIRAGGIEYATSKIEEMIGEAKEIITEVIPHKENREALCNIADYIGNRDK